MSRGFLKKFAKNLSKCYNNDRSGVRTDNVTEMGSASLIANKEVGKRQHLQITHFNILNDIARPKAVTKNVRHPASPKRLRRAG